MLFFRLNSASSFCLFKRSGHTLLIFKGVGITSQLFLLADQVGFEGDYDLIDEEHYDTIWIPEEHAEYVDTNMYYLQQDGQDQGVLVRITKCRPDMNTVSEHMVPHIDGDHTELNAGIYVIKPVMVNDETDSTTSHL